MIVNVSLREIEPMIVNISLREMSVRLAERDDYYRLSL